MSKDRAAAWLQEVLQAHGAAWLASATVEAIKARLGVGRVKAKQAQDAARQAQDDEAEPAAPDPAGATLKLDAIDPRAAKVRRYRVVDDPEQGRLYIVPLRAVGFTAEVTVETHRAIFSAYSKWNGRGKGIAELADQLNWEPKALQAYLRQVDMTHWGCPVPAEDLTEGDRDDMVRTIVAEARRDLYKRKEVAWRRQVEEDAGKWIRLEESIKVLVHEEVGAARAPAPPPLLPLTDAADPYAAVVCLADVHVGRYGDPGICGDSGASLEKLQADLDSALEDLLGQLAGRGGPEQLHLVILGDWFHCDNAAGGTTAGTPQSTDGDPTAAILPGLQLGRRVIQRFRSVGAQLHVHVVPGNHDYWSLLMAGHAWAMLYQDSADVRVHVHAAPRAYVQYGTTLIALSHGDGAKEDDLVRLVPHEAREMWARTTDCLVLVGHWHHQRARAGMKRARDGRQLHDKGGVTFVRMVDDVGATTFMQEPSIAGEDPWHVRKGFVGARRGLVAHLLSRRRGRRGYLIGRPD